MSENEKDKETKKTSEAESFEDYEGEAMEKAAEDSGMEERSLSFDICSAPGSPSVSEETEVEHEETLIELYEEKKRRLAEEKWLNVTGKKPKNIPVVRKYLDETEKLVFFGDRRPKEVEIQRRQKFLREVQKTPPSEYNQGKIRLEVFNQYQFNGLLCIKFEPGGENVAICSRRGQVQVLKTSTDKVLAQIKTIESANRLAIRGMTYHPKYERKLYVAGDTGKIQVFDGLSGELLGVSESFSTINVMDINSDGSFLTTGGRQGRINVIDSETLQVISSKRWPDLNETSAPGLNRQFHRLRIYGLKFHPTRTNFFVTGGWDGTVKIWDARTLGVVGNIVGPKIYGCGVDLNETEIITASWQAEGSLSLWSLSQTRLIKNIPIKNKSTKFDGEFLYAAHLFCDSPAFPMVNGRLVAVGGSGFFNLLVLNIDTEQVIAKFPSFKPILGIDTYGNMIAYGGKESLFRVGEIQELPLRRRL